MTDSTYVKGLDEVRRRMQGLASNMKRNYARGAMRAAANVVKPVAQANIHSVSGELAKGLKVSTKVENGLAVAKLKATGPHAFIAHMLEFTGASAHTIMPSVKKALALGGVPLASVEHPGFRPKPFMRPAADAMLGEAVVAAGNYVKARLGKQGIDASDIEIEEVQ